MEQSSQSLIDSAYKKIEAGDYNGARRDFRDLTGITPKDTLDYVNRGLAYNGLGDYKKACEDYEKASEAYNRDTELETDPQKKMNLIEKSASISGLSHAAYGRATDASRRVIVGESPKNPDDQFYPKDKWDYYCGAIEYKYLGKTDKAKSYFNEAIKRDNGFFDAHKRLGWLCNDTGDFTGAIDALNEALRLSPDADGVKGFLGQAYHMRGTDYIGKNDYPKAIADLTESIRLPQHSWTVPSHGNRGVAYYRNGEWDKAIEDYSWVIENGSKSATIYLNRGGTYEKIGEWDKAIADYDKAIADYDKAIDLDPNADAYDTRGTAYTNKGDYDKAIADYTEAIRLDSSSGYFRRRGNAYAQIGDKTKAIADYVEALKLDPNNENAKGGMEELQQGEVKTSTQNFIDEINSIQKKFSALIASGEKLEKDFADAQAKDDADYAADKHRELEDFTNAGTRIGNDFYAIDAEIESKYKAKIIEADAARDLCISNAATKVRMQENQFQAALSELDRIEADIPEKFRKNYLKAAVVSPQIPDFQEMVDALSRINRKTYGKMAHALLDKIESARAYINGEKQKWAEYEAQTRTIAIQEYRREEAEADVKKPGYLEPNQQKYRTDSDALNKNHEENIASLNEKHDAAVAATRSKYEQLFTEHQAALESELNNPELPRFDEGLRASFNNLGALKSTWKEYTPSVIYPAEVMLGFIKKSLDLQPPVHDKLKEKMPTAFSNGHDITLPFTASMSEPLHLLVEYEKENKDTVMAGIQSIILKLIRFMPAFSVNLTYIDPNDRGTNLGPLQKLADSTFTIFTKTDASKEDIAKRLKQLEGFVDRTSAQLAGVDNVYLYNNDKKNETKIPYQFIVINDYPDNFDSFARDSAQESLQVLLKNADKCGLSFIFTSSNPQNKQLAAKTKIEVKNNAVTVYSGAGAYSFDFGELIPNCDDFIETVKAVYTEGIKVDNRFAAFFKLGDKANYMESTKCVSIPFAVDSLRHRVSLELGGTQSVNALLSGRTGSGKSTTLHMLISSIVMNYHPDDVELWLVDYKKVEFAEYIKCLPPHVRLLGLERDTEFTFSLLDKIDKEFQRRLELFKSKGISSITECKEKFGVRSIPRIILIIDEFHQMTQAIKNEPRYVQILENILSEYRAFGLSCVFSDQAISDGLRGLTEKGKKQISIRIAMENDISEIRETLALDSSFYDESLKNKIQRMSAGDVIFKRLKDDGEPVIDKYKTILISREERTAVINRAKLLAKGDCRAKNLIIVDGQKRAEYKESTVSNFEKLLKIDLSKQILVYVGTPVNLNPCFVFALRKKTDSNIMVIGSEDEMRASILFHTIRSFKRQTNTSVIVFAYKSDEIYRQYQKQLAGILNGEDSIITNFQEMCGQIEQLKTLLNPDNEKRILICWLGLEEIADEFSIQPEKRQNSNKGSALASGSPMNVTSMTSNIDALLAELDGTKPEKPTAPVPDSPPESLYDACPDIQELFAKGSRYNLYSFVTFSSVKMIRQTKFVKLENFEHKIALAMSIDDSTTYLGRGAYASGLDALSAVYDDGSGKVRTFRPYTL